MRIEGQVRRMPRTEFERAINASDLQEWIMEAFPDWCKGDVRLIYDHIDDMPSAQPEIIRCTECKHYREYDSEYVENAVVVQCMADRYPISETIPDGWFCAGAERRTDDKTNKSSSC